MQAQIADMASIARGDMEILVHTTAPSRGQDDARYRALAQAYLDFEPSNRRQLIHVRGNEYEEKRDAEHAGNQLQEELLHATQEEPDSAASYRPDEQHESHDTLSIMSTQNRDLTILISQGMDSPDLSFNSAHDNRDSPLLRGLVTCRQELPPAVSQRQSSSQDSWKPPPSTIADSQPERIRPMVAFSSPTRIWEVLLQHMESSEEPSSFGSDSGQLQIGESPQLPSWSQQTLSTPRRSNTDNLSGSRDEPLSPSPVKRAERQSPRLLTTRNQNITFTQNTGNSLKCKHTSISSEEREISSSDPSKLIINSSFATKSHSGSLHNIQIIEATAAATTSNTRSNTKSRVETTQIETRIATLKAIPKSPNNKPHVEARQSETPFTTTILNTRSPDKPQDETPQFKPKETIYITSNSEPPRKRQRTSPTHDAMQPIQEIPPTSSPHPQLQRLTQPQLPSSQSRGSSPPKSTPIATSTPTSSRPKLDWSTTLEIHPPLPAISTTNLTPEHLTTPKLEQIAAKMRLSKHFQPIEQRRELRPMERGYWLVPCEKWTDVLKAKCWGFLGNLVGMGGAGWGVWCVRDEEFKTLKVYGWGTLVGHIYLLLYMASLGKIKGTGACWVGGDGSPIIRMPS